MVNQAKTKEEIIDLIFKDPEVKHGLKIFPTAELGKLNISEEHGKSFIKCPVSDRKRVAKPEEIIRQLTINKLTDDLHYPLKRLDVEVAVKMGSTYASKKADIVIYAEDGKENPYIIIEVKKPLRKDGLEQLHSYMNATGVYYGGWINGNEEVYQLRTEPNLFETLKRLPAVNEDLDDVKTPIRKSELEPIHDLKEMVLELENTVLANAGVSAFDAIFPLVFAKLRDEFNKDAQVAFKMAALAINVLGPQARASVVSSTLVALAAKDNELQLVEFDSQCNPETVKPEIAFSSIGIGKSIADPFLAFVKYLFWKDHLPSMSDGNFAVVWTLKHACRIAPSGIREPIQMAVLAMEGTQPKARKLPREEILDHELHVDEVEDYFRKYQEEQKPSTKEPEPPQPPHNMS